MVKQRKRVVRRKRRGKGLVSMIKTHKGKLIGLTALGAALLANQYNAPPGLQLGRRHPYYM
jgi:hypothetical protein